MTTTTADLLDELRTRIERESRPARFIVQWRTSSGWTTLRGYRSEAAACRACARAADNAPGGDHRVITGDPHGAFNVVAMRSAV